MGVKVEHGASTAVRPRLMASCLCQLTLAVGAGMRLLHIPLLKVRAAEALCI